MKWGVSICIPTINLCTYRREITCFKHEKQPTDSHKLNIFRGAFVFCDLLHHFESESVSRWSVHTLQLYVKGSSHLCSVKRRFGEKIQVQSVWIKYSQRQVVFFFFFLFICLPARWHQHRCWPTAQNTSPHRKKQQPCAVECCHGNLAG